MKSTSANLRSGIPYTLGPLRGRRQIDSAVKVAIMLDKAVVDLSHWDEVDSFEDAKDDGAVGIIHKATESNNYFDPNS